MDLGTFLLGTLSGLIIGGAGGWLAHILTLKRTRDERRATEQREQLDHCRDVFAARLAYILAFHRSPQTARARQQEYHTLMYRYWDARPEVLVDSAVWAPHKAAEVAALDGATGNVKERTKRVERTAGAVLDWLAAKRQALL